MTDLSKLSYAVESEGPTFTEIIKLAEDFFTFRGNSHGGSFFATDLTAKTNPAQALEAFARAFLQRWGRPALTPIPAEERLPGTGDCDAEGRCWWWIIDQPGEFPHWIYAPIEAQSWAGYSAWLPHHALPVPASTTETP